MKSIPTAVHAGARRVHMSFAAALAGFSLVASLAWANSPPAAPIAPKEHQRGPEQTFLTYPEWFLVHSPAEYAAYVKDHDPSNFPFFGHIGQFWQSYGAVHDATKDAYPFNFGYHVMVMVIGVSTTVEYALRSAYETIVGRIAELSRTHGETEEDTFGARIAQDYVDFIRVQPWYEYDYADKLARLWRETSYFGPDLLRKWERKYALTTEYAVKGVYAKLIKVLTKMGYEEPLPVTAVVVEPLPAPAQRELSALKVLQRLPLEHSPAMPVAASDQVGRSENAEQSESAEQAMPPAPALVTVPRYYAFKQHAAVLARHGAQFREIAGNRGDILLSVLVPASFAPQPGVYKVLFTQPIITRPEQKRVALTVPVASLHTVLNGFAGPQFQLEHVYDY